MGTRLLIIVALAACERTSTRYCELHGTTDPQSCGYMDAPIDTPKACTTDPQCSPDRCDLMTMQCVQCLTGSDCPSASPFCEAQTHTCQACRTNGDCADSHACLPSGQCADPANVIYADGTNGSDTGPCTLAQPCKTITHALTLVTATRATIRLLGAFDEAVVFRAVKVAVVADPGTTLTTTGGGAPSITFTSTGSSVHIRDLEIKNSIKGAVAVTAGNDLALSRTSIHDTGDIAVSDAGTLDLSQSLIYSNLAGGISMGMGAKFLIRNNFIHHNGSSAKDIGGVLIPASTGQSALEFNTIVDNTTKGGGADAGGVSCAASGFQAPNNIIARNTVAGSATAPAANVAANSPCDFTGSSIDQTDVTALHFLNPDSASGRDYHLGSGSIAIDASTVPSTVTEDFDGDIRPRGPAKDLGADER
jgi:Right handed beta helix region